MSRVVVSRRYATATPACSWELFMPCSIRSANVINRPIRRPSVALFPLLAPSLSDPPFLIRSAMGFKRMEHTGGDRQHAGRSHRRAVAWQGRSDGCQVGHRRGFSSLVRVGRRGRLSFLTTFPPFGRVFRLAGRSPIGACPSLL